MFELNLIHEKVNIIENRKKYLKYFQISISVIVLLFILLAIQYVLVLVKISGYKSKIQIIQKTMEEKRKQLNVDKVEKEWNETLLDLYAAKSMVESKTTASIKLHELNKSVPKGVFIDKIFLNENEKNMKIDAIVFEKGNQEFDSVNEFITNLAKNPVFGHGVKIESHQRTSIDNKDAELFNIIIQFGNKTKNE